MLPTLPKKKLTGVVAILSFGLTALFAVFGFGPLVPATFVLGFFILLPLIGILGEDFPLVEPEPPDSEEYEVSTATTGVESTRGVDAGNTTGQSPVEQIRERYARGEISEEEFEQRLERLLETEHVTEQRQERTREPEFE